jgi:hypothetical protein
MKADPLDRPAGIVLALQKARSDAANSARAADLHAKQRDEYRARLSRIIDVRSDYRPLDPDSRALQLVFSRYVLRSARDPVAVIMAEVERHVRKEFTA